MNITLWRFGFGNDGQRWAVGAVCYKNTLMMKSGTVRRDAAWKYLGFGIWWKL